MKYLLSLFIGLILLPLSSLAADPTPLALILDKIEVVKQGEKDGDELYIDLSIAKSGEATKFMRIPEKPMHWPSRLVKNINKVQLWTGMLKEGDQVTLLLSLNEKDDLPLNVDDFIGSVEVVAKNVDGKIELLWFIPGQTQPPKEAPKKIGQIGHFDLKSRHGSYKLYLGVQ